MKAKSIKGKTSEEITTALQESMLDGFNPTLAIVFLSISQDREGVLSSCLIVVDLQYLGQHQTVSLSMMRWTKIPPRNIILSGYQILNISQYYLKEFQNRNFLKFSS